MKTIIVDDENLALRKMERLLQSQDGFNVNVELIGAFQSSRSALAIAAEKAPDLAFLDIEMPEMSGFELAERLMELHPSMQIVFVTAYQDFAVRAFEINALDYLLKPVHASRLAVTMNRVSQSSSAGPCQSASLCCLRSLHFIDQHQEAQSFPWKTLKAPELFAYLIYYRGKTVSKQTLMDLLWPDHDIKKATTQLHTAIYQIRRMIKTYELDIKIKYQDEGYRLEWGSVTLDAEEWETSLREAPAVMPGTLDMHMAIMDKYTGDFLEEHRYTWAEPEQERLRLLWLDHAKEIAECRFESAQYSEAIGMYQKMIEKLPYIEEGYAGLMRVYAMLHHPGEVRRVFQMLEESLLLEYGMSPSKELIEWYRKWERENSFIS
ncbi:response regulator [Paenibacillus sp. HJL G12]|uniref:Response regulator n=1 Tax=Paenibacillus dendrobii TaxID=2691084 RepID=A0A7X3LL71_9BACL|nr:response regulator [Paenibacillus dendrobii]MWV47194.1 response regulator [Paenibacillus dendrobii]